jgi:hypothetical protein
MKHETRFSAGEKAESAREQTQQPAVTEFANAEAMLRHDAMHTPVPPSIAQRLQESLRRLEVQPRPWWKRLLGG